MMNQPVNTPLRNSLAPCCAPTKYAPMQLLFQSRNSVKLQTYTDLIVESCGCNTQPEFGATTVCLSTASGRPLVASCHNLYLLRVHFVSQRSVSFGRRGDMRDMIFRIFFLPDFMFFLSEFSFFQMCKYLLRYLSQDELKVRQIARTHTNIYSFLVT